MIFAMFESILEFFISDVGDFILKCVLALLVLYWLPYFGRLVEKGQEYINRMLQMDILELNRPQFHRTVVNEDGVKVKMSGDIYVSNRPRSRHGRQTFYVVVKVVVEPNPNGPAPNAQAPNAQIPNAAIAE